MSAQLVDKMRAILAGRSVFSTLERRYKRYSFDTDAGEVGKSTLDAWQRKGWVERTSIKALPDMGRVREWALTEEGAEALMLEDCSETEAPLQSDGQPQHSPELPEQP